MDDIMKIVKCLKDSGLLIKGVSYQLKTTKNKAKEHRVGLLNMLLGTSSACLLGNLLTGKGVIRAGEGTNRADQDL